MLADMKAYELNYVEVSFVMIALKISWISHSNFLYWNKGARTEVNFYFL